MICFGGKLHGPARGLVRFNEDPNVVIVACADCMREARAGGKAEARTLKGSWSATHPAEGIFA